MSNKDKKETQPDGNNKLWFEARSVLIVVFVLCVVIKFFIAYSPTPYSVRNIIDVLCDTFIAATSVNIWLSFTTQSKMIGSFSNQLSSTEKNIKDAIDKVYEKQYFDRLLAASNSILSSKDISGNTGIKKDEFQGKLHQYSSILANYSYYCTDPLVYIHEYNRKVVLSKGSAPSLVEVKTITDIVYVNLTDKTYTETFNPQFLIADGGGKTYKIIKFLEDGKDLSKKIDNILAKQKLKPESEGSLYESGKKVAVDIPDHCAKRVHIESTYEVQESAFYQAKVFVLPCMKFLLTAEFDDDFNKKRRRGKKSKNYVFRWTFYETKNSAPDERHKKPGEITERENNILRLPGEYMKPGNGYDLTLAIIDTTNTTICDDANQNVTSDNITDS